MNPQIMQFDSQPGGYSQQVNYPPPVGGAVSPSGGTMPSNFQPNNPPVGSFPSNSRQSGIAQPPQPNNFQRGPPMASGYPSAQPPLGPPQNPSYGAPPNVQADNISSHMQAMNLGGQQKAYPNSGPSKPPQLNGPLVTEIGSDPSLINGKPQFANGVHPNQVPPMPQPSRPMNFATSQNRGPPLGGGYPPIVNQANGPAQLPPNQGMPPKPQQFASQPHIPGKPPFSPPGMEPYHNQGYPPPGPQQINQPYPPQMNQGYSSPTNQGYQQQNPNYPSPHGYQSPPQQQKRLDPDQMPSPIQVMLDDEKTKGGIFYTNQKGLVPPLATTNFITQDQGNCSPRFMRSSMYNAPISMDMMKQTAVPFALVISPLARLVDGEISPPIVNMGEVGPVRCIRCKAYMSPYMQFIDGGRRFHCLLCKATTEVPPEYFQHLDHTGQRVDRFERPELVLGTYEFLATKDYCKNNQSPNIPAMIFVIDVSYNNMKSGLVHLLCSNIKQIIRSLPREEGAEKSQMRVGFITYSTSVHFYNIKGCLASPQMMVVGDVQDMFMPLLDGFLCDPYESEIVIDQLMNEIPNMFSDTRETETILYPAIQAGLEALKAADCAGKLLVFHSSLPIGEAPGKLKNRDDRKLLGTEKEKQVLAPQNTSYNNLGQECVQAGCSVDLFVFNNSFIDLATIGQVCRLTGGEVFKYTYFQADIDGDRFLRDLQRNVSRRIAFDAIMRVRTSTGVRATDFYGHFFMSNTTDMELAAIDSDKAIAVEIKHDDKLTEEEGVYIQVALLYTSCSGQRRLRILNLSLKTCSQMADLYRSCDLDTIINFLSKQGVFRLYDTSPKQVKDSLVNRCATILACYRKNCASPSSAGQLILPECMKLLPLYINTIMKSDAISGGSDMSVDDRSFAMFTVLIMDINSSLVYFYPRLTPLHLMQSDSNEVPLPIRCTVEKLSDDGVFLLDNGVHMFMWLGMNASPEFISNVFGVPTVAQVDIEKTTLPALDNPLSVRIRQHIEDIREERHRSMRLRVSRQTDRMDMVFKQLLMEDASLNGIPSYLDFLCRMHKEITTMMT